MRGGSTINPLESMSRRNYLKTGALVALGATLSLSQAQEKKPSEMIGKFTSAEFDQFNDQAAATVKAIRPGDQELSETDIVLVQEIAKGSMMQLEASRVAAKETASDDVRAIAKAEIAEQTTMAAKLKEITEPSNMKLPKDPDAKGAALVTKLEGLKGSDLDMAYLRESGVAGHEMLKATMTKVRAEAQDEGLKALAAAALPLIETHLTVARDEVSERD